MRKCTITIIVLILIILAIPAITGQYFKYVIQHKIANNKWPNYTVKLISYDAGWFHSKARFIISTNKMAPQQGNNLQPQIDMNLRIFHGPLVYVRDLAGQQHWFWGQGVMKGNAKVSDFPLQVFAQAYFNNDIEVTLKNTGYKYFNADKNITILLSDLNSHIMIQQNMQRISGETVLQKATLLTPKLQIMMPKLVSHFKLERNSSGLWVGQRDNLIPLISLKGGQLSFGTITDMNFYSQTQINNNLMQGELKGQVRQIMIPALLPLGPLNINYKMSNIDVNKVIALNQFLASANLSENNPNREQIDNQMLLHFAGLIQGSTQDLTDLSLGTSQGGINVSFHAQFPKQNINVNQTADKLMLQGLFGKLWQKTQAYIKIRIPSKLALAFLQSKNQDWLNQLNLLHNVGAIKTDGNYLSTEIIYNHGTIFLNGELLQNIINNYKLELQKSQPHLGQPVLTPVNDQSPSVPAPSVMNQTEQQQNSMPLMILQMLQKQKQTQPPLQ
jgi:hypothetical protein